MPSRTQWNISRSLAAALDILARGGNAVDAVVSIGFSIGVLELAQTLRRIAERGSDGFYRGEVAERIASHVQSLGGVMTVDDG